MKNLSLAALSGLATLAAAAPTHKSATTFAPSEVSSAWSEYHASMSKVDAARHHMNTLSTRDFNNDGPFQTLNDAGPVETKTASVHRLNMANAAQFSVPSPAPILMTELPDFAPLATIAVEPTKASLEPRGGNDVPWGQPLWTDIPDPNKLAGGAIGVVPFEARLDGKSRGSHRHAGADYKENPELFQSELSSAAETIWATKAISKRDVSTPNDNRVTVTSFSTGPVVVVTKTLTNIIPTITTVTVTSESTLSGITSTTTVYPPAVRVPETISKRDVAVPHVIKLTIPVFDEAPVVSPWLASPITSKTLYRRTTPTPVKREMVVTPFTGMPITIHTRGDDPTIICDGQVMTPPIDGYYTTCYETSLAKRAEPTPSLKLADGDTAREAKLDEITAEWRVKARELAARYEKAGTFYKWATLKDVKEDDAERVKKVAELL